MVTSKIYKIQVSNDFAVIAPIDQGALDVIPQFNSKPLLNDWANPEYEFQIIQSGSVTEIPDVSLLVGGAFVFRGTLKEKIFPLHYEKYEFLPISVAGEDWLALNCLEATMAYDCEKSIFYRGLEGQIFLVKRLVVNDASLVPCGVFVIDDSNRSSVFVLSSFVDRINTLGLKGVEFKEIGYLDVQA